MNYKAAWLALMASAGAAVIACGLLVLTGNTPMAAAALALALVVLACQGFVHACMRHQRRLLERLRAEIMAMDPGAPKLSRHWHQHDARDPVYGVARSILDVLVLAGELGKRPDRRLEAVIEALDKGVMVINGDGLISLINAPAAALVGQRRAQIGTSVFAALPRGDVLHAMRSARRAGHPITARFSLPDHRELEVRAAPIPDHRGLVLIFDAPESAPPPFRLRHDLSLHDVPPRVEPAGPQTALDQMHWVCLDTETTGLDVHADRVISIGGLKGFGRRMYAHLSFDELVHPGMPIPPRSTAIHGLTDFMVSGAEGFATVFRRIEPMMRDCVLIGHNVAFDLAMLENECRRHRIDWKPGASLDTYVLAKLLLPEQEGYSLDRLAEELNIEIRGRHTAFGDSLVTADLYLRLLPHLREQGVSRLGEALEFMERMPRPDPRAPEPEAN